jgi:hypothetical protein
MGWRIGRQDFARNDADKRCGESVLFDQSTKKDSVRAEQKDPRRVGTLKFRQGIEKALGIDRRIASLRADRALR